MAKDEKDSIETETSQSDPPVDIPPPGEHENQDQPAANLPQQNVQFDDRNYSIGDAEENVIVQKREDLIEELPAHSSPEAKRRSPESIQYTSVATASTKPPDTLLDKINQAFIRAMFDQCFRFVFSVFVTIISCMFAFFIDSGKHYDVGLSIAVLSGTWFILTFFKRGTLYSAAAKCMGRICPCSKRCIVKVETPRRSSQFNRVDTNTKFEHEVADTSNPNEMPRIVYRYEETDVSSTEHRESPKVVNVDVYDDAPISDSSKGACGYSPPEGRAGVYSSSDSGGEGSFRRGNVTLYPITKSPDGE